MIASGANPTTTRINISSLKGTNIGCDVFYKLVPYRDKSNVIIVHRVCTRRYQICPLQGRQTIAITTSGLHPTLSDTSLSAIFCQFTAIDDHFTALDDHFTAVDRQLTVIEDHFTVIEDHLTVIEDHITVIEDHFTVIEDHFTAIDDQLTAIDRQLTAIVDELTALGGLFVRRIGQRRRHADHARQTRTTPSPRPVVKKQSKLRSAFRCGFYNRQSVILKIENKKCLLTFGFDTVAASLLFLASKFTHQKTGK